MGTESIKIVIIDDDPDLCFLLSGMLTSYGYKVSYFHTLQDGIEGVGIHQPDWVIVDNNLPDGLGWEGANEILKMNEHVHIIKISANPDSPRTDKRYNVHYLIKPIMVQSIVDLINDYGH